MPNQYPAPQPRRSPTPLDSDPITVPDGGDEQVRVVYSPAEAAELLRVPESWLRRKAGTRQVPCTLLGRHLRFSVADLNAIVTDHTQPAGAHSDGGADNRSPADHITPAGHRSQEHWCRGRTTPALVITSDAHNSHSIV